MHEEVSATIHMIFICKSTTSLCSKRHCSVSTELVCKKTVSVLLSDGCTHLYHQENELVVCKALQESESRFELEYILPEWSCRGLPLFSGGKYIATVICTLKHLVVCVGGLSHTNNFYF